MTPHSDMYAGSQEMTILAAGPGRAVVAVSGQVDAGSATRLRLALLETTGANGGLLEVDLAGVTFMDSSGLRAMADASVALQASGTALVLCNVPRQLLRIFENTAIWPLQVRR